MFKIERENNSGLIEDILQLDEKNLYFVGVIDECGRLEEYVEKQTKLLQELKKDSLEMLCIQAKLYTSMQSDHEKNFGKFGYCVTDLEKITLLIIPTARGTILTMVSKNADSKKLSQLIYQIANDDYFANVTN